METSINNLNLSEVDLLVHTLTLIFRSLIASYIFLKLIKTKKLKIQIFIYSFSILITLIYSIMTFYNTPITSVILIYHICLYFCNYIFSKQKIIITALLTLLSHCIYYIVLIISLIINFIFNLAIPIQNDLINFILISLIYVCVLYLILKIKRLKNGFNFLENLFNNFSIEILFLNIGGIILFLFAITLNLTPDIAMQSFPIFIIFSILMIITIYKSFKQYYKQKLVDNEINELRNDVIEKDKMIAILKEENLKYSKLNHSIMHKQKSLEYKLNNLIFSTEASNELTNINLDDVITIPLKSTGITKIDDMLKYMQSECVKNNIEFELILNGNINHIINNFISVYDLEILLADLIKNAIIAINNCDNVNKSILLKLGLFDNFYSFCIYDSGCEFEESTLSKLGTEPSTTHSSTGGTGMGFMNTFETLRKINAAITIKEIGIPSKENYTKYILIQFNKDFEFILDSYKKNIAK